MLFGDEPAGDPEKHVFAGLQKLRNPWSRFGTKSAQNDVSTISLCIKKNASETMVFHSFAMFIPLLVPFGIGRKHPWTFCVEDQPGSSTL